MMDYAYEIDQLILFWKPVLALDNWDIQVNTKEKIIIASCQAQPQYLTAMLSFNLERLREEIATKADLEELVLHELVHARLWALANVLPENVPSRFVEYFEEEATSQITQALLKVRYYGQKREGSEVRHVEVVETREENAGSGPGEQIVSPGIY